MRSNRGFNGKLSGKWRGGENPPLLSTLDYQQCRRENLEYQQLVNPSQ